MEKQYFETHADICNLVDGDVSAGSKMHLIMTE
jgi:hypothetical protein